MIKVAFLGLGRMGFPMARRVALAGFPITAWNRSAQAGAQLRAELQAGQPSVAGLQLASSAAAAVEGADCVITMLSDGPAVAEVLFGPAAVASSMRAGSCLVDMSSIPPDTARTHAAQLARRGVHALDAPVSGGVVGASEGRLAIMVGGDRAALAAVQPVLAVLGRVTPVGASGAGQLAKLANQVIVGVTIGAVAEALLLAARGGADARAVRQAIRGGFAESRILELHGERMLDEAFQPGGAVQTQLKDLDTALAAARAAGLDLPITRLLAGLFADAAAHGDAALDHAALLRELGRHNGLAPEGLLGR